MFAWITERLGLAPPPPPPRSTAERQEHEAISREATHAVRRADQAIDVWNERLRESWRAPPYDA